MSQFLIKWFLICETLLYQYPMACLMRSKNLKLTCHIVFQSLFYHDTKARVDTAYSCHLKTFLKTVAFEQSCSWYFHVKSRQAENGIHKILS